jgi:hypothetical protein
LLYLTIRVLLVGAVASDGPTTSWARANSTGAMRSAVTDVEVYCSDALLPKVIIGFIAKALLSHEKDYYLSG